MATETESLTSARGATRVMQASVRVFTDRPHLERALRLAPKLGTALLEQGEVAAAAAELDWVAGTSAEHDEFYRTVDAPFVGDGFTRWVDGQFALDQPELGLSNWQAGRLFARGGVLSGDSVYTVRLRAAIDDPGLHR